MRSKCYEISITPTLKRESWPTVKLGFSSSPQLPPWSPLCGLGPRASWNLDLGTLCASSVPWTHVCETWQPRRPQNIECLFANHLCIQEKESRFIISWSIQLIIRTLFCELLITISKNYNWSFAKLVNNKVRK